MAFPQRLVPLALLLLALTLYSVSPHGIVRRKIYVIRSTGPHGLVLDATNPSLLTVQHFTGFKPQLWTFEPGSKPGFYYIINESQGKVLDYNRPASWNLVLANRDNSLHQQWNLDSTGKITNAALSKNIDIWGATFTPGTQVGLWHDGDYPNQKFALEEKS
ncbi:hypothetical protein Zmor_019175 [Zophobas morio]|uniref:Ricin B lectin domain-containing protein n=1 Tax=Zophobas morio TaxID=2755281 RepID=A0AA38M8Z2_9CUCU|nr:hypothetical protein Zmor_019175 [Zophobas morio]